MSRVDIVVPCHNYGEFLRECVDSVILQSHRDLRVLVIDDASTDQTPAISAALAARDARVEVRRHETNHGHIETYNEGIAWAEGDYWLLLSADDLLLPGALERAVAALDGHRELGLVYGPFVEFRMGQRLPYRTYHRAALGEPTATLAGQKSGVGDLTIWAADDLVAALAEGAFVGVATAVARVSVQREVGFYRPDLPHSGDLELWLRFALQSKVGFIDSLQAVYRVHDRNMSLGYRGYRDFCQRVLAFDAHHAEILRSLSDGDSVERRIRRSHRVRAAKSALRSLSEGRVREFRELCRYLAVGALVSADNDMGSHANRG